MIFLSESAIHYAFMICREKHKYKVNIATATHTKIREIENIVSYLQFKWDYCNAINVRINHYSIAVDFKNGSKIRVFCTSGSAKGRRCHLLILDKEIPYNVFQSVLRPTENLEIDEYIELAEGRNNEKTERYSSVYDPRR